MYQFLLTNKDLITLIISICAFIISLVSFFRTKVTYNCIFKPNLRKISEIKLINTEYKVHKVYKNIQMGYFDFINLSPYDLGYFDLMAINQDSNEHIKILMKSNIPTRFHDLEAIEEISFKEQWLKYDLPEQSSGVFKAKSNTRIYFVMQVPTVPKVISVSFRITHRNFFHFFKSNEKDKFKLIRINYINGYSMLP